jgi:hypothetical protein
MSDAILLLAVVQITLLDREVRDFAAFEHTLLSWHQCYLSMGARMELRHLPYFVAVAEAGSLTVAAARKLHTSQPSLGRQIRDLEDEVRTPLLTRRARSIELTPGGSCLPR